MKKILLLLCLMLFISYGQSKINKIYHPFTGTLAFSLEGGTNYGLGDYNDFALDYFGRFAVDYYFPFYSKSSFGLRLFGNAGYLYFKDSDINPSEVRTEMINFGLGAIYTLAVTEVFYPYFIGGVSYLRFEPKNMNREILLSNNDSINYKKNELNFFSELGFRFMISDNFTVNLFGGVSISSGDLLDAYVLRKNDLYTYAGLGFTFSFFGEGDSDKDGVVDSKDLCPDTPPGVRVDIHGCPIDTDKDGVPDYLDKCPNTPEGVKVDEYGCPVDSDGDGVPDYIDICPGTLKNVEVDEYGCPIDSDNDGVPDYLDSCPGTPDGVKVDRFGCPVDSDRDGVPDYLDRCPNTPLGTEVDEFGCPKVKQEPKKETTYEVVLSSSATFAIGKTELLPDAYLELDKLVKVMKDEPNSTWLIEGHTDNTGPRDLNLRISLQRAQSVLNYFVSRGISSSRFQVRGMGPDFPVASNSIEEGRSQNRRVKIVRVK